MFRQKRFLMENNRFGQTPFAFDGRAGSFYTVFLKAFGLFLLLAVGMGAMVAGMEPAMRLHSFSPQLVPILLSLLFAGGYLLLGLYVYARLSNLTWNATRLGDNRFVSTLRVRDLAWIFFSNAVAIALSVGLLIPWASVRLARYRTGKLALDAPGDLGSFLAGSSPALSAAGEEIGDIFGVDIGF
jgi:uncharacterized membrane protein YjgN (DUF898 family)